MERLSPVLIREENLRKQAALRKRKSKKSQRATATQLAAKRKDARDAFEQPWRDLIEYFQDLNTWRQCWKQHNIDFKIRFSNINLHTSGTVYENRITITIGTSHADAHMCILHLLAMRVARWEVPARWHSPIWAMHYWRAACEATGGTMDRQGNVRAWNKAVKNMMHDWLRSPGCQSPAKGLGQKILP